MTNWETTNPKKKSGEWILTFLYDIFVVKMQNSWLSRYAEHVQTKVGVEKVRSWAAENKNLEPNDLFISANVDEVCSWFWHQCKLLSCPLKLLWWQRWRRWWRWKSWMKPILEVPSRRDLFIILAKMWTITKTIKIILLTQVTMLWITMTITMKLLFLRCWAEELCSSWAGVKPQLRFHLFFNLFKARLSWMLCKKVTCYQHRCHNFNFCHIKSWNTAKVACLYQTNLFKPGLYLQIITGALWMPMGR